MADTFCQFRHSRQSGTERDAPELPGTARIKGQQAKHPPTSPQQPETQQLQTGKQTMQTTNAQLTDTSKQIFIRLQGFPQVTSLGLPTCTSPEGQASPVIGGMSSSPCLSSPIAETFVDLIPANTEDPFTLELFQDCIREHALQNKTFVLARVTTQNQTDEKVYYSYYQGHQINKVLFRTQPDLGLLHRMKARNVRHPSQTNVKAFE